jgi:elongation factor P hydroxylase
LGLRPLNDYEKNLLTPYIPQIDLDNADIHEDGTPWYVSSAAKGETEYNDIYFKKGAYNSCTAHGIALLAHELVHVGQYRDGLTPLGYILDPDRRQTYEVPAYDLEEKVKWALLPKEINGELCSCPISH